MKVHIVEDDSGVHGVYYSKKDAEKAAQRLWFRVAWSHPSVLARVVRGKERTK